MTEAVAVTDLAVRYPGFTLQPVSLRMDLGERVALLGANGSGKTTLLNAIAGRRPGHGGQMQIVGHPPNPPPWTLSQSIGFLGDHLLGLGWMTVAEHLQFLRPFYPRWDSAYVEELVDRLQIPWHTKLGHLSRGMTVKLGFVSAEAFRPPVLLMDEPTAGLDPVVRNELLDVLDSACGLGPRLVLFSTHLLEDVETLGTRVIVLHEGHVVIDRSVDEIQADSHQPFHTILRGLVTLHGHAA